MVDKEEEKDSVAKPALNFFHSSFLFGFPLLDGSRPL
jgi:hypothetical protein